MNMGLGGAMFYSLESDDFYEGCFQEKFPLLKAINHQLNQKNKFEYPESEVVDNNERKQINELIFQDDLVEYFKTLEQPVNPGNFCQFTLIYVSSNIV